MDLSVVLRVAAYAINATGTVQYAAFDDVSHHTFRLDRSSAALDFQATLA